MAASANGKGQRAPSSPLRHASGWLPLLMSGAATALLVAYWATGPHEPHWVVEHGVARADESAIARLWQFLIVMQLPIMGWFAVRWLPRQPKRGSLVLAAQALAVVAAALPIVLLEG